MTTHRKSLRGEQHGFSPVFIILLVLILAAIGFAAWRVFGSEADDTPAESTATTTTADTESEVTYVKPVGEAFQVALPEDWTSGTCADSANLLFLAPTTEQLGKCQSEFAGTVAISKNDGDIGHDEAYYMADSYYGDVVYSAITIDGIAGYKVSYTVATESLIGYPPVGTKHTLYVLYDGADTYMLTYTQLAGEADLANAVQDLAESFDKL